MKRFQLNSVMILLSIILTGCALYPGNNLKEVGTDEFSEEQFDVYTGNMLAEGFDFCPDSYLEISIIQNHVRPQFNFLNQVSGNGELPLAISGTDKHTGLKAEVEIPLVGEGMAGFCQFTSSGIMNIDIIGRLIPGENDQPNLLFYGQCDSSIQSKQPCGDFGMIPLEKKVYIIIPYQDGESFEWEWKNLNVGISGSSKWTLYIPCDR